MSLPRSMRRKLPVIIAGVIGAVLFDGTTLFVASGVRSWGRGTVGEPGPNLHIALSYLVSFPSAVVLSALGKSTSSPDSLLNSDAFVLTINGVVGAVIFGAAGLLWRIVRSPYEK